MSDRCVWRGLIIFPDEEGIIISLAVYLQRAIVAI
jgi:hypothetical protein